MSKAVYVELLEDKSDQVVLGVHREGKQKQILYASVIHDHDNLRMDKTIKNGSDSRNTKRQVLPNSQGSMVLLFSDDAVWGTIS